MRSIRRQAVLSKRRILPGLGESKSLRQVSGESKSSLRQVSGERKMLSSLRETKATRNPADGVVGYDSGFGDHKTWLDVQRKRLHVQSFDTTVNPLSSTPIPDYPDPGDELLNYYSRTLSRRFKHDKSRIPDKSLTQILDEVDQMSPLQRQGAKTWHKGDMEMVQYDFGYRQRQQMRQDISLVRRRKNKTKSLFESAKIKAFSTLSTLQSLLNVKKGGHNTAYAKIRRGVKRLRMSGKADGLEYMVIQMYDMGMTKKDIRDIMGITFNQTKTPRYIGTSGVSSFLSDVQYGITSILSRGNKTAKEQSFRLSDVFLGVRDLATKPRKERLYLSKSIANSRPLAGNIYIGVLNKASTLGLHAYKRGTAIQTRQTQEAEMRSYRSYDSVSSETHQSEGHLTMEATIGIAIAASIAQELLVESATSFMTSEILKTKLKKLLGKGSSRATQKVLNHAQSRMGIGIEIIINMTEFLLVAAQGNSHVDRYGNAAHGNFSGLAFAMDQLSFPAGTAHGIKYAIDLAKANAEQRSYVVNAGHMARDFDMMMREAKFGHAIEASQRPVCRDEQRVMRATVKTVVGMDVSFETNMPSYRRFCSSYDLKFLTRDLVDAENRSIKLQFSNLGPAEQLLLGDRVHISLPDPASALRDEACFQVSSKTPGSYVILEYVAVTGLLSEQQVTARMGDVENLSNLTLITGTMFPVTLVSSSGTPTHLARPHWFGKHMYAAVDGTPLTSVATSDTDSSHVHLHLDTSGYVAGDTIQVLGSGVEGLNGIYTVIEKTSEYIVVAAPPVGLGVVTPTTALGFVITNFSTGVSYGMIVNLGPGRVRLGEMFETVRQRMVTQLMTDTSITSEDSTSRAKLDGENQTLRFAAGSIQTLQGFDNLTVTVTNADVETKFEGVGRSDYSIEQKSGDPTQLELTRAASAGVRVYRSGEDREKLLVVPPAASSQLGSASFSAAVRPPASRVSWSSSPLYSGFDVFRVTSVEKIADPSDDYLLTVNRSLPDHLVGSTVHVGDTSDATLVRWVSTSRTQLVVRLPRHTPVVITKTTLKRNATPVDATATSLVVDDATGITTNHKIMAPFVAEIVSVTGQTLVLDRLLGTVPDAQTELTLHSSDRNMRPTWKTYRGPRDSSVTLERNRFETLTLIMSDKFQSINYSLFADAVLVEACGNELRMRVASNMTVSSGSSWALETPALSVSGCILVPTLRMRGAPDTAVQQGDVVRFSGEKVARRVRHLGNSSVTTGNISRPITSQSMDSSTDDLMRRHSLTFAEALPDTVLAHVWRATLSEVEKYTFPIHSINEARTTVVIGDLHNMWPRTSSSVVFYDPAVNACETVLSNAGLPDAHSVERLPEDQSYEFPQCVVNTNGNPQQVRSLARVTLDTWKGASGLAARCAWHGDMDSSSTSAEVTTPKRTRMLLRNAQLSGGVEVQPVTLRRGNELRAYGSALLDRHYPQMRGQHHRIRLQTLSAGPRLEDPHMGPSRFPPPTSVRCVGPTIWRLEWNTGFTISASAGEVMFLMPKNVYNADPFFDGIVRNTVRQSTYVDIVPRVSPVRDDQVSREDVRVNLYTLRNIMTGFSSSTLEGKSSDDNGFTARHFTRPRAAGSNSETSGWIMRRTRPPALRVWRNLLSGVETRTNREQRRMEHRPVPPVATSVRLTQGFTRSGNTFTLRFPGVVEAQGAVEAVFFIGSDDAEQRLLTSSGTNFLTPTDSVSDSDFAFGATPLETHGTYNYPSPTALSTLTASSVAITNSGSAVEVTFDWLADATQVRYIEYVPTPEVHLLTELRRVTHFRVGAEQARTARVLHSDPELTRALHTSDFSGRDATSTRTNRAIYPNLRMDDQRFVN